jgi:hypothetical protein
MNPKFKIILVASLLSISVLTLIVYSVAAHKKQPSVITLKSSGSVIDTLSQEQRPKKLTKFSGFNNTPIRISNIRLNDQTLSLEEIFMSDDQWLKRVEFEIQNISDKNIIALELVLLVQTEVSPDPFGLSIRYGIVDIANGNTVIRGVIPGLDDIENFGVGRVPVISPNSTLTLRCSDEEFARACY